MTANNAVGIGDPDLLQVTARRFPEGTEENYENPGSGSRHGRCCIYVVTTVYKYLDAGVYCHDQTNQTLWAEFRVTAFNINRSQWPRCLRHESYSARTLVSWVRIPFEAWMSVCVYSVCVDLCIGSGLIPYPRSSIKCVGLRN
jgi:hypothetical protein